LILISFIDQSSAEKVIEQREQNQQLMRKKFPKNS
jgi:hypothetical protein